MQAFDAIAGYTPGTDVVQHNQIDLDQQEIEAELKESPADFAAAKTVYEGGGVNAANGGWNSDVQG